MALEFKHDHNKVAFLGNGKGYELYEPMVEFLKRSKICYALTHVPNEIYESLVTQFWESAEKRSETEIRVVIDGTEHIVTEDLIRRKLHLEDADGAFHSSQENVLTGLRAIGYRGTRTDMWLKKELCPKWRFLVHTLLQCMSNKTGGWDQFSTQLGYGIVCLSQGEVYEEMISTNAAEEDGLSLRLS